MTFDHITGACKEREKGVPGVMQTLKEALDETQKKKIRNENITLTKQAIRESVTPDRHIINAINTIEEIDKVANRLAKRLRVWYSLYNPELDHERTDHQDFVEAIMENLKRSESTMGGTFPEKDFSTVLAQAQMLSMMYAQRDMLFEYLETSMQEVAPNVTKVAGAMIGAKLIAIAGSLERLMRMPSGTVQLLGAENALFRHLKDKRVKPPKHGIIFNHQLLQRAPPKKRGKAARAIADALAIAVKVDYFKGEYVGDALYAKVEARIK